ncbi:MAG: hypothetical protein ON057_002090 [Glomeribacter sp. 1016415]|nr:hypothetical protein [Glomeribacter sp. 1016415]
MMHSAGGLGLTRLGIYMHFNQDTHKNTHTYSLLTVVTAQQKIPETLNLLSADSSLYSAM